MRLSVGLSILALSAVLAAQPVAAATINLGGNGNNGLLGTGLLSGNGSQSSDGSTLSVNTNLNGTSGGTSNDGSLLNLFGDGSTPTSAAITVNTNGSGTSGNLLNLFGDGQDPTTATVTLGGNGTNDANALVDLFGDASGTGDAQVSLGGTGLGSGSDVGVPSNVTLDLFGNGNSGGSVGTLPGTTGGYDGSGSGSGAGGGVIGGGGTTVASLDSKIGGSCFTPNASQLAKLAGRHTYDTTTFEGWMGIKAIKVIRAGLCPQAARDVAAQTNIGQLQTFFGSNAALRDQLAKWGHGPGDVIAVDRQGSTLIVYVA